MTVKKSVWVAKILFIYLFGINTACKQIIAVFVVMKIKFIVAFMLQNRIINLCIRNFYPPINILIFLLQSFKVDWIINFFLLFYFFWFDRISIAVGNTYNTADIARFAFVLLSSFAGLKRKIPPVIRPHNSKMHTTINIIFFFLSNFILTRSYLFFGLR